MTPRQELEHLTAELKALETQEAEILSTWQQHSSGALVARLDILREHKNYIKRRIFAAKMDFVYNKMSEEGEG